MATRTLLTVPQRTYQPGARSFPVSNFGPADTDWLEVSFTVVGWPAANPLISGFLTWSTGDGQSILIASPPKDRRGNPLAAVPVRIPVPQDANGKVAATSATVAVDLKAAMTTAITVTAGTDG